MTERDKLVQDICNRAYARSKQITRNDLKYEETSIYLELCDMGAWVLAQIEERNINE